VKILIVNAYLRNSGDAALLSVLITQLKAQWPGAEVIISSREGSEDFSEFDGCKNIGSIRLYTERTDIFKVRRILRKAFIELVVSVWPRFPARVRAGFTAILPKEVRVALRAIDESDLVVSTGGGYINGVASLGGNLNIKYITSPLLLAKKIHKTVVFGPESYGPLATDYQRQLVAKAVNASDLALVREDNSYRLLLSLGVDEKILSRAVDSGFAFDNDVVKTSSYDAAAGVKIGMTARLWYPPDGQYKYEKSLADFITYADKTHHAKVSLVPQVTSNLYSDDDDRNAERSIAKRVAEAGGTVNQIDDELSHHQLKRIYSDLDFTVGTRFHSVIFSLTSYVPCIAIEYEHKTSGIMKDLGLDDWVIKIDDVTAEKLQAMFERLMQEREQYVAHLHKVLPGYIAKADNAGTQIRQAYEQHAKRVPTAGIR